MNIKHSYIILMVVFVFSGFLYAASKGSGNGVFQQLGSVVGMYASIEPNEYNELAQELKEYEQDLQKREAVIAQKEVLLRNEAEQKDEQNTAIIYTTAIGVLLLLLILYNYYLDWRRKR
jgi:cell shape-determining protein MreC